MLGARCRLRQGAYGGQRRGGTVDAQLWATDIMSINSKLPLYLRRSPLHVGRGLRLSEPSHFAKVHPRLVGNCRQPGKVSPMYQSVHLSSLRYASDNIEPRQLARRGFDLKATSFCSTDVSRIYASA